jgi:hypothetical protein
MKCKKSTLVRRELPEAEERKREGENYLLPNP